MRNYWRDKLLKDIIICLTFLMGSFVLMGTPLFAAPVVSISSDLPSSESYQIGLGDHVLFYSDVVLDDDSLFVKSYKWNSSLDGSKITSSVQPSILDTSLLTSTGTHIIQFYIIDSNDNMSNIAVIEVVVGIPPTVLIKSPTDNSTNVYGSILTFIADARDQDLGNSPLTGNNVVWSSDRDGFLSYENFFTKDDLSVGTHEITVTATASSGLVDTDSITITIEDETPVVLIKSPTDNSNHVYGSILTFIVDARDLEDGPLTGNSIVWTSDKDGFLGYGTFFTEDALSVGTHIITVTATDSSGLPGSDFITVIIGNASPVALIKSPADNSSRAYGSMLTFIADARDLEDGPLTGSSIVWMSNRDGFLGYGNSLAKDDLSVGTHTITVTATDSSGLVGSASITITIGNAPPVVLIRFPTHNSSIVYGEMVVFLAAVTDIEDGNLTEDSIVWVSDRDGFLGFDTALSMNNLSVGTHKITVTATDSSGLVTSASITITIKDSLPTSVEIVKPLEGDSFNINEYIEFEGTATDNEDGTLSGDSLLWTSNLLDTPLGTGKRLSIDTLAMGTHLITLTATDSSGNTQIAVISITIEGPLLPEVNISAPADGDFFPVNEYIEFMGSATDNKDGILRGESLVWKSNLETVLLGTGEILKINTLSTGKHLITLTATDSDSLSAIDFIVITVENTPPEPVITSPYDGAVVDDTEEVHFAGYAADAEDGTLTGSALSWISDLDGFLGSGVVFVRTMSPGEHLISLIAKDSHGEEEKRSIKLTVNGTEQSLPMTLEESYISLFSGQIGTFSISGGHPPYHYYREYPHIATMDINGHEIRIVPESMGESTFQIVDHENTFRTLHLTVIDTIENLPFADAGQDQTVLEGTTVTLDGTPSLPGKHGISSWMWYQIDNDKDNYDKDNYDKNNIVVIADNFTAKAGFVAPSAENNPTLTFRLTVRDVNGNISSDDVIINILTNALDGYPDGVISFFTADSENSLGLMIAGEGDYVAINPRFPEFIKENAGRPENMIYGLVDLKIKVEPGGNADMIIYLPAPADEDYGIYKYSDSLGWYDYSQNCTFSSDRSRVYVILTDGGAGDDDGMINGIISDPITFGTLPLSPSVPASSDLLDPPVSDQEQEGEGDDGGGCFISTIFN